MQANTTSCKTGSIANFYLLYTKVCTDFYGCTWCKTGSKPVKVNFSGFIPCTASKSQLYFRFYILLCLFARVEKGINVPKKPAVNKN